MECKNVKGGIIPFASPIRPAFTPWKVMMCEAEMI